MPERQIGISAHAQLTVPAVFATIQPLRRSDGEIASKVRTL